VAVHPEYLDVRSFSDFIRIFAVWEGGITITTGLIGGVVAAIIWSKWRKADFVLVADSALPTVLASQALGRWGNFLNQEIFGKPTDVSWFPYSVYIPEYNKYGVQEGFYQATFFYEMVLNLLFLLAILFVLKHLRLKGAGTLLYFFSYPLIRFIMEFMRYDGDVYDVVNYTQIIVGLVALGCAGLLAYLIVRAVKKGEKIWFKEGIPNELNFQAKKPKPEPPKLEPPKLK
jgi:phosphatidylglycerol:prolipoprotein diacylglycerol transferase